MLCSHESDVPSPLANEPGCVMTCVQGGGGRGGGGKRKEEREESGKG